MLKNLLSIVAIFLSIVGTCYAQLSVTLAPNALYDREAVPLATNVLEWPDTVKIAGVTVQASQYIVNHSFNAVIVDSLALKRHENNNLGELLKECSNVFIKSYGQGSLATPSFRGTGASHTQVLWNGIAINSPMLGQTDFSMVPVFFTDQLSVYQSGTAFGKGSALPGGSILFENSPHWDVLNELNVSTSLGSFGLKSVFAGYRITKEKIHVSAKVFVNESDNDFSFKNTALSKNNPPIETRIDAGFTQKGALLELYNQPNTKNQIVIRTWLQQTHREVPQPMIVLAKPGNEYQDQSFVRTMANWAYFGSKIQTNTSFSWLYEDFFYRNIVSEISSRNFTNGLQFQTTAQLNLNEVGKLSFAARVEGDFVNTVNYAEQKSQLIQAYSLHLDRDFKKMGQIKLGMQVEAVDGLVSPLLPSVSYKAFLLNPRALYITSSFSGTYHSPSLNDRYWMPGGNPNLQAEKGFSSELGLGVELNDKWCKLFVFNFVAYYSKINNLIIWQPDTVFSYWRPFNMKSVRNQGVEARLNVVKNFGDVRARLIANYTYTQAKNTEGISLNDLSVDKQLIYTPMHSFNTRMLFSYKRATFSYFVEYVGKRFTSSDNSRFMPAYSLHNATIGYGFKLFSVLAEMQFQLNNILDSSYQSIAWQPMPGRNFRLNLKLTMVKK